MSDAAAAQDCNHELLRAHLAAALVEADKCDPLVAIDIENALALLDKRIGLTDEI